MLKIQPTKTLVFILFIFVWALPGQSQTAQWQGPDRNALFPDTGLLKEWPAGGPTVLFAVNGLGKSYSSAVAAAGKVYTTGTRDSLEYLTALGLDGKILWQKPYGRAWNKSFPESRTTPAVDGDRIYVISGLDDAVCLNANSGEILWKVNLNTTFQGVWDMFGVSESPLIYKNLFIATPGGKSTTVVTLDKLTGKPVWKSPSLGHKRSNMSSLVITHGGKDYLITSTQTHLLGVDITNGEILWTYEYNFLQGGENTTIFTNTPTYKDGCLWVSNGWDVKSVKLEIAPDGRSVKELIADHTFDNQNHGVVLVDTLLFGSNFTGRTTGKWVCMNWNTGEILWIEEWFNKGPVIYADGMLYCYEEKQGNVALVKADPKEFRVISTFRVKEGTGPHWAHPAIYNGILMVRHGDYLIGYDLRKSSYQGS